MFDASAHLWLIPALPLAAAVLTGFLGPRWLKQYSHWPCIIAVILACALSFGVLAAVYTDGPTPPQPDRDHAGHGHIRG
jgi:NADH:ubiquinone oxidoreductase subunit 5 (subunit L)/multisubunit Na+/H+ antiporter MnhA subunit